MRPISERVHERDDEAATSSNQRRSKVLLVCAFACGAFAGQLGAAHGLVMPLQLVQYSNVVPVRGTRGRQLEQSEVAPNECQKLTTHLGLSPPMIAEINHQVAALPAETTSAISALPPLRKLGCHKCKGVGVSASTSWLQEVFVRLHRILFMQKLLPLSQFGEFRHSRWGNMFDKVSLSRRAFVLYNRKNAFRVAGGSQCLGWDTHQHISAIHGCSRTKQWLLKYKDQGNDGPLDTGPRRPARVDLKEKVVYGDLTLDRLGLSEGDLQSMPKFDLVVCNQVVEHVKQPFVSARTLYDLLKPGGLLFWTAPFLERNHFPNSDFFRYTADGAREIFVRAGFNIVDLKVVGDTYVTSGYMLGFGAGDIDEQYTNSNSAGLLQNATDKTSEDPQQWLYMGVAIVARRPA